MLFRRTRPKTKKAAQHIRFLSWLYDVILLRHGDFSIYYSVLFALSVESTVILTGNTMTGICVTAFIFFIYSAVFGDHMGEDIFYIIPSVCCFILLSVVLMIHSASVFRAMFSSHG
ncbi:hypothetical protein NB716_001137 [Pantoea ananatis]|nr:hypothetical protein [Pantoea ananatis]